MPIDDGFRGADWDPQAESNFFSGDKPSQGHPGAAMFSFDTLRMAAGLSCISPYIQRTSSEVVELSQLQRDKWGTGCKIGLRDRNAKLTKAAEKKAAEIWDVCNRVEPFHATMQKVSWDSSAFDWGKAEIQFDKAGRPYAFKALDASTIRRGKPVRQDGTNSSDPGNYRSNTYVQLVQDRVVNVWDEKEIMSVVRRRRSGIYYFDYGYPEIQQAADAIMSFLNIEAYNNYYFRNGTHASAILKINADMDRNAWNRFKMLMTAQLKGVENAHRLAMVLLRPGGGDATREDIDKLDMAHSNVDMQFTDLMLIKGMFIAASFGRDPREVGLPIYKGAGSMSESNPQDQINYARERALLPTLLTLEDALNTNIVQPYDEDFAFYFVPSAETEMARLDADSKAVSAGVLARNEARANIGKEPVDEAYFKKYKIPATEDQKKALIIAASVPMDSIMLQALGSLMPPPPEEGGEGGPPGAPGDMPPGAEGGDPEGGPEGQEEAPPDEEMGEGDEGDEPVDDKQGKLFPEDEEEDQAA